MAMFSAIEFRAAEKGALPEVRLRCAPRRDPPDRAPDPVIVTVDISAKLAAAIPHGMVALRDEGNLADRCAGAEPMICFMRRRLKSGHVRLFLRKPPPG
jgi:hypothetical protein